jgi:hypothetical protein
VPENIFNVMFKQRAREGAWNVKKPALGGLLLSAGDA